MDNTGEQNSRISDSFIRQSQPNLFIRILKTIDVFSFIPVPKDDSVSTKQSLVGTAIFFVLFLTYVIYDFVGFIQKNPPIVQSYRTQLDNNIYKLPRFAYAFMNGTFTNQTSSYNDLFSYSFTSQNKNLNGDNPINLNYSFVTYDRATGNATNFDLIPWMSDATKRFYYNLRTPAQGQDLYAQGLLYASDITTYVRLKLYFCVNATSNNTCLDNQTIQQLSNHGRIFLFIENQLDRSSISLETDNPNGNNYLLFNFFLLRGLYKRVNINFQVVKQQILPDYFLRWSTQKTERLQVQSIFEEVSDDAIAFNFQLSPIIINNRVSFVTLIDHVSKWGAFWGVLFAVFAIFFLSYNRRKFYKKNPDWSKFKKAAHSINNSDEQNHLR